MHVGSDHEASRPDHLRQAIRKLPARVHRLDQPTQYREIPNVFRKPCRARRIGHRAVTLTRREVDIRPALRLQPVRGAEKFHAGGNYNRVQRHQFGR